MQEQAVIQTQESELFKNYELKGWEPSPRLYKILAASFILNMFLVVGLAKANFLTAKSCDTVIMSSVCSVLDTLYVGSEILSSDTEFVSKDYDKTELSDDEIIMVDLTGESPPLTYPEGYFALANPEQQFMALPNDPNMMLPQSPDFSAIPNSPTTPDLLNTNPTLPPQNNNVIQGQLPSSPLGDSTTTLNVPKSKKLPKSKTNPLKNESPKELPNLNSNTTAEKTDENKKPVESETVKEVEINKKPFEDLGDAVNEKLAKNEVDLNQPFLVVMDGTITPDGKLDRKKSRFIRSDGDQKMVDVAKQAIEAVGDSGFLGYLKNQGVDRVNFQMGQDDKQFMVIIVSDQKNPNKANTTASGFNTLLQGLTLADQTGISKLDERSKFLISNAKVTSNGNNFVFNFVIPKPDGHKLIQDSLRERAEKKAAQPSTKTEAGNSNTNAQLSK